MELANDFVLPADYYVIDNPWKKVYLGVFTQSWMDLNSPVQPIYNNAYRWFVDLRSTDIMGMQNCCDVLGLDAQYWSQAVRDGHRLPAFARPKNGGAAWKVTGRVYRGGTRGK